MTKPIGSGLINIEDLDIFPKEDMDRKSLELQRLVKMKAVRSSLYKVGPLNMRFMTLNEAREYALTLCRRLQTRVWIHTPEGKQIEFIDDYKRPKPICGE